MRKQVNPDNSGPGEHPGIDLDATVYDPRIG